MHFRISSWLLIAFGAVSVLGTGQFISPPDATAGTSGTNLTYGVANTVEWNKVADYVVLSMGYGSYTNATITWFIGMLILRLCLLLVTALVSLRAQSADRT